MKEEYVKMEISVDEVDLEDIITTSGGICLDDGNGGCPDMICWF